MSSSSGVEVSEECLECFQDLKLKKTYKYILYKISDDYKSIVLERPVRVGEKDEDEFEDDETGKDEQDKEVETVKDEQDKEVETVKDEKDKKTKKEVAIDNYPYFYKMLSIKNEYNPRYAVYDFDYEDPDDIAKKRNKLVFYSWVPAAAKVRDRMVYASSREAIRKRLDISTVIQGTEKSEITFEVVLDKVNPNRNKKN